MILVSPELIADHQVIVRDPEPFPHRDRIALEPGFFREGEESQHFKTSRGSAVSLKKIIPRRLAAENDRIRGLGGTAILAIAHLDLRGTEKLRQDRVLQVRDPRQDRTGQAVVADREKREDEVTTRLPDQRGVLQHLSERPALGTGRDRHELLFLCRCQGDILVVGKEDALQVRGQEPVGGGQMRALLVSQNDLDVDAILAGGLRDRIHEIEEVNGTADPAIIGGRANEQSEFFHDGKKRVGGRGTVSRQGAVLVAEVGDVFGEGLPHEFEETVVVAIAPRTALRGVEMRQGKIHAQLGAKRPEVLGQALKTKESVHETSAVVADEKALLQANLLGATPVEVGLEGSERLDELVLVVVRLVEGVAIERDLPVPGVPNNRTGKIPAERLFADEARDLGRRGVSVQAELLRFVQDARLEKSAPDARARILVDVNKEQLRLFGKKHAFGVNVRLVSLVRQGRLRRSVLRLRQRQPPGRSRDARAS